MSLIERSSLARKIISEILYINLATADATGKPWCSPVFTAYNDRYEFYWASGFETQHSQNIRQNSRVGVTIYDSKIPEGDGEAVYMQGMAYELTPKNWQEGLNLLRNRSQYADKFFPYSAYQMLGPVRIYCFKPEKFYMLNPNGDARYEAYADCRDEIDIFQTE